MHKPPFSEERAASGMPDPAVLLGAPYGAGASFCFFGSAINAKNGKHLSTETT
jgi:hypothetical protein